MSDVKPFQYPEAQRKPFSANDAIKILREFVYEFENNHGHEPENYSFDDYTETYRKARAFIDGLK